MLFQIPKIMIDNMVGGCDLYIFYNGVLLTEFRDYDIVSGIIAFNINIKTNDDIRILVKGKNTIIKGGWYCIRDNNWCEIAVTETPIMSSYKGERDVAPTNNDGRTSCYWCGAPTRKVQGMTDIYDICGRCKR